MRTDLQPDCRPNEVGHRELRGWRRIWECILHLALVLWVVRVAVIMTALGLLILGMAPQAQDLFVEFARPPAWRMFLFLFVLIAVWAMPTHYAARLLLDTDAGFQQLLAEQRKLQGAACAEAAGVWVPRKLGLLTFAAVLIAIWRSYVNLPILDDRSVIESVARSLAVMAVLVLLGAVGFIVYCIKRPRNADLPGLRAVKRANRRLARLWRTISPGLRDSSGSEQEASRDLGRLLLAAIFVVFLAMFLFGADVAAWLFPRAMAVPFILGGWLPFLSYLSGAGRQLRAPLIVGLFALISLLVVLLGDNHSVRRINTAKTVGHPIDTAAIPLDAAVTMWMQENKCFDAPATCPRPIVIAAAGGASRAAFFTASIIGYFMQEASDHGLDPNQVRNRLFAISSVSGSSMGAIMVATALDAKADSNDHPCAKSEFALWWGITINNWRDCFEALTSGDFLSADFFGFAFNDMLPFGLWRDRAAVLEDSWDDRYQAVVTRPDKAGNPANCKGLNCPFLSLRPRPGHWIPLLVLNGTSEATGGRIVTTALAATYMPSAKAGCPTSTDPSGCALFADADYFHDLLKSDTKPDSWLGGFERRLLNSFYGDGSLDDVQLNTAAHNSARFPFISPPGSVRNRYQTIVDRIVDGGYFENYGALSAKELALAVHAVQPDLAPMVLVISNDPDDLLDPAKDTDTPAAKAQRKAQREAQMKKARAAVDGSEPVTDLVTPLMTVANARTAHGILGVDQLRSSLAGALPGCEVRMIHVRVWPQLDDTAKRSRAVSMSWWLSTPIQRHLHQQTEATKNANENGPRLHAVWEEMKASSSCATAPRQ
jgi:hypothetical protein